MSEIVFTRKKDKSRDKAIIKKAESKKEVKSNRIIDKIRSFNTLQDLSDSIGNSFTLINTLATLEDSIQECLSAKYVVIKPFTCGNQPMIDDIIGIALSIENNAFYIPINHIDYISKSKLDDQLTVEEIKVQLQKLSGTKIVMHDANKYIRSLAYKIDVKFDCYWDTMIAAHMLNENEKSFKSIDLCKKYKINDTTLPDFDISIDLLPLNICKYVAQNAKDIYNLFKFQYNYFVNTDKSDIKDVYKVFTEIEMPCLSAIIRMEDRGIEVDNDKYLELLSKYNKLLDESHKNCINYISNYKREIASFTKNGKLSNPINLNSMDQVATILYDILKLDNVNRGTDADTLKLLNNEFADNLLLYRKYSKLVGAFLQPLPKYIVNNKVHTTFNQVAAVTGRFSSTNPNMQQIPAKGEAKELRQIFKAKDNYILISADFSAQEPRLTAQLSQDTRMLKVYNEDRDLYVEIASVIFNKKYEDCLEFHSDGTINVEGKQLRDKAKIIWLSIAYGIEPSGLSKLLNCTVKEAEQFKLKLLNNFIGLKGFEESSFKSAVKKGYVQTLWGRKRRFPELKQENSEYELSRLKRQVVNSIIQGSGADMTKKAIIIIDNDRKLKELGFELLLTIHDELIGQCPINNLQLCENRLKYLMNNCANDRVQVPIKSDIKSYINWGE